VRRIADKGVDGVTTLHKLVGVGWLASGIAMIFGGPGLWYPAATSALACACLTLAIGLVYGFWTDYGFIQHYWVVVKWALGIVSSGAAILVVSNHLPRAAWALLLVSTQLVLGVASIGLGVYLERRRHGTVVTALR
jgi:hypothetical protein